MNRRLRRFVAWGVIVALTVTLSAVAVQAETVEGIVFVDLNGNGSLDSHEVGLPGVTVSDGAAVSQTGDDGRFQISPDDAARFIFISTPSGTSAGTGWYRPVAEGATGELSFALNPQPEEGPLVFVQISDIHYAPNPEEFREGLRDRRMAILPDPVLTEMADDVNAMEPDFVILAGDLVADSKYPEPARVDEWMKAVADFAKQMRATTYGVVGNHDVVRDEAIGKESFESSFGPTYYSFNVKGTHCVVLDTQQLVGTKLVYTVDKRQLEWLERDLESVGRETPILVFCHEPSFDWADTEESRELFSLLQAYDISALLNGHWHTNAVLREEPFLELTSGAASGAWWEGPGPDGTGFGYRVFRFARGNLDSMWRTAGAEGIEVMSPGRAVLVWADQLSASTWGRAESAGYRWDGGDEIALIPHWNGLWTTVAANLNSSTLDEGYHTLTVWFSMVDGTVVEEDRTYMVSNPEIPLGEIVDHPQTYQGRIVAANELTVRAAMGSDISAYDETKTIIISGFPFSVSRGDLIGIVGIYRPTSTAPIKVYDDMFYTVLDGAEDEEE